MLAKSRTVGVEFITFFENGLYYELAKNANDKAQQLKAFLQNKGIAMYVDSPTNQIFPIFENSLLEKIKTKYRVTEWCKYNDNHTVVRLVCSWATKQENVDEFINDFNN